MSAFDRRAGRKRRSHLVGDGRSNSNPTSSKEGSISVARTDTPKCTQRVQKAMSGSSAKCSVRLSQVRVAAVLISRVPASGLVRIGYGRVDFSSKHTRTVRSLTRSSSRRSQNDMARSGSNAPSVSSGTLRPLSTSRPCDLPLSNHPRHLQEALHFIAAHFRLGGGADLSRLTFPVTGRCASPATSNASASSTASGTTLRTESM